MEGMESYSNYSYQLLLAVIYTELLTFNTIVIFKSIFDRTLLNN